MASLLNCPAELRQQILGHCLPGDVHDAGTAPRTAALLPLLLTCRTIRLDVLEILRTWSPVYHFEDPAAAVAVASSLPCRRRDLLDAEEPHVRRISLRLFAGLDLGRMHSAAPMGAADGVFDAGPWLELVGWLPEEAVESVTVDLTPAPAWMTARRPDWVRATVLDARNRVFLAECAGGVRELVRALRGAYGAWVTVQLGGSVPRSAGRAVEGMMVAQGESGSTAAEFGGFAGEWLSGPVEVPTRLSLALVCRCWGVEVAEPAEKRWYYPRMNQIRNEVSAHL